MGRNKTSTVYPDGTQMTYEYDSLGRLKKKSDRNGNGITYGYDCMGRVQTVTGSTGQQKSYTYDVMGNVSAVTDADGNTTRYAYTFNGRLREVTDALGSKTEYTYDKADRLVCICQHGQEGDADRTTEYERDAFGQVRCIRDAAGGEEYFRYDSLGRLAEKTDREGLITAYSYTADGMPESILYGGGRRAELEYTPLRHLAVVKDWLGETRIERDSQDTPVIRPAYPGTIRIGHSLTLSHAAPLIVHCPSIMVRDADRHAIAVPLDPRLTQPVLYFRELPQGAVFQPCPPSVPVQDTFRSAVCRVGICCHQSFPVCLFYHSSQRVVAEMLFAAHGITDTFHLSKGVPLILRRPVCPACLSMLADTDQAACLIIGIYIPSAV